MFTSKESARIHRVQSLVPTPISRAMQTLMKIFVAVVLCVCAAGCATEGAQPSTGAVKRGVAKKLENPDLIPPAYWNQTRHWLQKMEITMLDASAKKVEPTVLMAQVERSKLSEVMVGSSVEGWVLYQAVWDGKDLMVSIKPAMPKQIEPAVVMSDLQIALWPGTMLQAWYAKNPALSIKDDPLARTIYKNKAPWVSVRYSHSPCETGCSIILTNHQRGYQLSIQNLAAQQS